MKFKGLIVLLVLAVGAATLLTAFAGHSSSFRYSGSVVNHYTSVALGGTSSDQSDIVVVDNILPPDDAAGIPGWAICANPGSKKHEPGGINPVPAFAGQAVVDTGELDEQGRFSTTIVATTDLTDLDPAVVCPNKNWTVTSWIPLAFKAVTTETAVYTDGSQKALSYVLSECTYPADTPVQKGVKYDCVVLEQYHSAQTIPN